jgi:hypothetical protein
MWVSYLQYRYGWRDSVVRDPKYDSALIVDPNLPLVIGPLPTFIVQRLPVSQRSLVRRFGEKMKFLSSAFYDCEWQAKLMRPISAYEGESLVGEHDLHTDENMSLERWNVNRRLNAMR